MKRIVIVGEGYQVGKAVRLAGKIHPKADLVWISDFEDHKYSPSMLSMLLKSGAGLDQWSLIRARIKVEFEKYQRTINLFPRKVKKINFDSTTSEVSFLTSMGKMSYSFDKALVFPQTVVEYPADLPENYFVWPKDPCIRYMVNNWKNFQDPVVVGSDLGLVQALVQSRKKFVWVRTGGIFSKQVQYFLDQELVSLGVKIISPDSDAGLKQVLKKEIDSSRDTRPVFFCGHCATDYARLERYGLKKEDAVPEGPGVEYGGNIVCVDGSGHEKISCDTFSPETQLARCLKIVEAALAGGEYTLLSRKIMFWNMGVLSAAKTGIDLDRAQEAGYNPEFALVHGSHGISGDKPYVLNMIMDRPTQKIIGMEAVGEKAHEWINLGADLIQQESTVKDVLDHNIIWPDLVINPLTRCARRLENKLRPEILGITPLELKQSADQGAVFFLLDVRNRDEFSLGRIPGATNIPLNLLKKRAMEIPRFTPIVFYSDCSGRAYEAARLLGTMGAKQLYVLDGGYGLYTLDKDLSPLSPEKPGNTCACPVC